MRLANPQLLWLLVSIPVLIVGMALRYGWRRRVLTRIGHVPQVMRMVEAISPTRRLIKTMLLLSALALGIAALARPQAGERTSLAPRVGIDIVVALDFSKSMLARDAFPSRIERAKAELNRLLDGLKGDRVGLVAFAGTTQSFPLTTDYAAAKLFWRDLMPNDMPIGGTAIGRAVVAATNLLTGVRGKGPERAQAILLLTDGEDHESDPIAAAKEAAKGGIRIYAVGIGSASGEPVPKLDEEGKIVGYVSHDGRPVTTRLNTQVLRQMADLTRGRALTIEPRQFGVEPLLAELAKLKKSEIESRLIRHYDDAYQWFLLPALLLLLLEIVIGERRPLKRAWAKQTEKATAARAGRASAALLVCASFFLLGGFDFLRARDDTVERGNQALRGGKPDEALKLYDEAAKEHGIDERLHFNRGLALSKLGKHEQARQELLAATRTHDRPLKAQSFSQLGNEHFQMERFDEATKAYQNALQLNPSDKMAKWNLELALRRIREKKEKEQQKNKNKDKQDNDKDKEPEDKQDKDKKPEDKQDKDKDKKPENKQDKDKKQNEQQRKQPQNQQKQPEQKQPEQKQRNRQLSKPLNQVLDALDRNDKNLQRERARMLRGQYRSPEKDW